MAGFGRIFSLTNASTNYRGIFSLSNFRNITTDVPLMSSARTRMIEKLGIPPKPKKPLTPFFKYMKVERPKLVEKYPHLKVPDVLKLVARQWAEYDPKEKQLLQKEFDTEMLSYSKQLMQYEQSITPEQRNSIKEATENRNTKRAKFEMKKKVAHLGRPKKPPTSFVQFLQEKKYARQKDDKPLEWVRRLAEEWKTMSPAEKEKYQLEAKKLMERYKEDMKEWEEKMVRMGHLDVVRTRGLIDLKSSKPE